MENAEWVNSMQTASYVISYFLIGLFFSVLFGTISKLLWSSEWDDMDFVLCLLMWILWPLLVPIALLVIAVTFLEDRIESSNFLKNLWSKLPEASELHPGEWFFAWPAKLYLLIRRKHEATDSN